MHFLIIMFFILELFTTVTICVNILKLDKKINRLNKLTYRKRFKITSLLRKSRIDIKKVSTSIKNSEEIAIKKRKQFIFNTIKQVLITGLIVFLGKKHSKKIMILELLLVLYDSYQENCTNSTCAL